MRLIRSTLVFVGLLVFGACAPLYDFEPNGTDTITAEYFSEGGTFTGGAAFHVLYKPAEFGGMLGICGATGISGEPHPMFAVGGDVRPPGDLSFKRRRLLPIKAFPFFASASDMPGGTANCFKTKEKWTGDSMQHQIFVRLFRISAETDQGTHYFRAGEVPPLFE